MKDNTFTNTIANDIDTKLLYTQNLQEHLLKQVQLHAEKLKATNTHLKMAVILVGDNNCSQIYVRNKGKKAQECGIDFELIKLSKTISQAELHKNIEVLNDNKEITGILLQLPLPEGLDRQKAIAKIAPHKDVDGLTATNKGKAELEQEDVLLPATPLGIMRILDWINFDIEAKNVVVIGKSLLVGQPIANMLGRRDATVSICHKQTQNIPCFLNNADLVVVATGCPALVKGEQLKKGAVVIDVGITPAPTDDCPGRIVGDVDRESCLGVASLLTPVPGGVGPMTIASLLTNVIDAAYLQAGGKRVEWQLFTSEN